MDSHACEITLGSDCNAPLLSVPQLAALMVAGMLTACVGGSGGGDDKPPLVVPDTHTVTRALPPR